MSENAPLDTCTQRRFSKDSDKPVHYAARSESLLGTFWLGHIKTRTGNYSAKYLFYRYDDVVAMILPVTGFRLECAKISRVESDNYPQ